MSSESSPDILPPFKPEEAGRFRTKETECKPLSGDKTIEDYFPFENHIASGSFGSVDKRGVAELGKELLRMSIPDSSDKPLPTSVVVKKVFPTHAAIRDAALTEMVNEISLLRQLSHDSLTVIPKYYGCLVGSNTYLVMEWIKGNDLIDLMLTAGDFQRRGDESRYLEDMDTLFTIAVEQGIPALMQLHAHGIVHGDVRPENIRIGSNGKCYLIDLGSSCFVRDDSPFKCPSRFDRRTRIGYADPALLLKGLESTATFEDWLRADWWSFGLILFYLAVGYHPYHILDFYMNGGKAKDEQTYLYNQVGKYRGKAAPHATPTKTVNDLVRKYVFDDIMEFLDKQTDRLERKKQVTLPKTDAKRQLSKQIENIQIVKPYLERFLNSSYENLTNWLSKEY